MTGKRRRPRTNHQFAGMLGRMIAAYDRRATADPVTELADLHQVETWLRVGATSASERTNVAIYLAQAGGQSYGDLARVLGMTKAAVIKRAKLGETASRAQRQEAATAARRAKPRELPHAEPARSHAGELGPGRATG